MHRLAIVDMGAVWGGQEIYSKSLATALSCRGWSVSHFSSEERHRGECIYYERIPIDYREFPRLRRRLSEKLRGMDVIHFNGIRAIYLSAILAKRQPFVGTKHSPHSSAEHTDRKAVAALAASAVAFHNLDWLISVSDKVLEELPCRVQRRSSVVLNGVPDMGQGSPRLDDGGQLRLCYVGRFIEQKGLPRLLEAIGLLRDRGTAVHLQVAGAGPLEEQAHRWVRNHDLSACVEFLGYCDSPALVYVQSHVCVLPSLHEGLPLSLLEAESANCALVAHDIPGVREVVRPHVNGLLTAPTAQGLADAIQQIERDRKLLSALRLSARHDYEQRWQLSRMVRDTVAVYEKVMAGEAAR